jgi:large subunit ribosomal protein L29e
MAKSKNHTAHNQSHKAHRNGIKRPRWQKYSKTKGMNPKYLKNLKWAKKHNLGPKEMSLKDKRANRLKALTSWLDQKNHAMKREYDRKYADKPVRAGRKTPVFRPLTQ